MATAKSKAALIVGEFTGFGPKTLEFLRDLGRNNEKVWFEAHRSDYEQFLQDPQAAQALASLVRKLGRAGYSIRGKTYKQAPRGFDGGGAAAEFVLHSGLSAGLERKSPPELGSARFAAYCAQEWKKLAPLHRWLIDNVG